MKENIVADNIIDFRNYTAFNSIAVGAKETFGLHLLKDECSRLRYRADEEDLKLYTYEIDTSIIEGRTIFSMIEAHGIGVSISNLCKLSYSKHHNYLFASSDPTLIRIANVEEIRCINTTSANLMKVFQL